MNDDSNYRVRQWQPPPRPDWVRQLNLEGSYLDLKSVVPLDPASLIGSATLNTGLRDFGPEGWREPFDILCKALDAEAELTLMGRLMTRSDLLMHLEARLRIEATYQAHPEIDDQAVASPMLIIGSGRSGTSALQNLLSCDPDNGTPKHWETLLPVPPPEAATYRTDRRIAIADRRMTQWERVTPEVSAMHEWGGEMPTELIQIETMSFQSTGWMDLYGHIPSYDAYVGKLGMVPGLSYTKRVLKLLQWKNPRQRWLLKNPDSLRYLPDICSVFPDIRLIWMHRDPLKAVASAVSLVGSLFWIRSDRKLSDESIGQITNPAGMAALFDVVINQIDQGLVPAKMLSNVQYLDFAQNPLVTVAELYRDMGVALTDRARQAMERYVHENPREKRPAHVYNAGDADKRAGERLLFQRYQTRFQVMSEI